MKRIFLILMFSLFSVALVNAMSGGPGVNESTAWLVTNCGDINLIGTGAYAMNHYYKLNESLNCSGIPGRDGVNGKFYVIGYFSGTFDGQGHYISNLNAQDTSQDAMGLFQYVTGVVQNLGVKDSTFRSDGTSGAIAGKFGLYAGKILNCYSRNNYIRGRGTTQTGGLAGYRPGYIQNSYAVSNTLADKYIAGIGNGMFISNSYSASNNFDYFYADHKFGLSAHGGGINPTITDSYSDATNGVTAVAGGIALNCYADINCGGPTFDITSKQLSELSSTGWDETIWCKGTSGFPILLYQGYEMEGQGDVCESQGPGGNGDEVIPEFSKTGTVIIVIVALVVVSIVTSMLMKKQKQ